MYFKVGVTMIINSLPISMPTKYNAITLAVLNKNMKSIEKTGQNMIRMMEQSVQPNLGQNIDIKV